MRKLLPLLVVSILVFGGLGTVAIPIEKPTEAEPLNTDGVNLTIEVKGGLLGYKVTITNTGNETIENISINMTIKTDAWIMIKGDILNFSETIGDLFYRGIVEFNMRPVLGFGPATINVEGKIEIDDLKILGFTGNTTGFVFLFYVQGSCDLPPVPIP